MMGENAWFYYAFGAAILWGLGYTISDILLKKYNISPASIMAMSQIITLPLWILIVISTNKLGADIGTFASNPTALIISILQGFFCLGGAYLILMSMQEKNAALASMIEISYPFFVVLFSWLIFKETQVNLWTALGGVLIFSGVAVIYLKS